MKAVSIAIAVTIAYVIGSRLSNDIINVFVGVIIGTIPSLVIGFVFVMSAKQKEPTQSPQNIMFMLPPSQYGNPYTMPTTQFLQAPPYNPYQDITPRQR